MSRHFTWQRLYNAVKNGDVSEVEEALFILDKKVYENGLVHGMNALTLAAKLGNFDIVTLLIDHHQCSYPNYHNENVSALPLDRANRSFFDAMCEPEEEIVSEYIADQLGQALEAASQSQQSLIINVLLSYHHIHIEEKYWMKAIAWAARYGDYELLNSLFERLKSQTSHSIEKGYTVLLETLYSTGNNKLEHLSKDVRDHHCFSECLTKFNPLHRSIFLGDRVFLERSMKKNRCTWYRAVYPERDTEWAVQRKVFFVAAVTGDLDCLDYLQKEASAVLGAVEVNTFIMRTCVEVYEAGRSEIVEHCLQRGWIQRTYKPTLLLLYQRRPETVRPFWGEMLNQALWNGHTDLAVKIMDQYFTQKNEDNVPTSKDLLEEIQCCHGYNKFRNAGWRNDLKVQSKLHDCVMSLAADEGRSDVSPMGKEFLQVIRDGHPEAVQYYLEQLTPSQVDKVMRCHWLSPFFIAQGTRMSVLNFEYFEKYSTSGFHDILELQQWGSGKQSQRDRFVEVLCMLLLNDDCARKLNMKSLPSLLSNWMKNCETEKYWRDAIQLFDFFDVFSMRNIVFTFTELGHAFELTNICRLFTIVCGTKLRRAHWPGLFSEASQLSESERITLCDFINKSGVCVTDPEFLRDRSLFDDQIVSRIPQDQEQLSRIHTQLLDLKSRPSPEKMTLASLCRIKIRQEVRAASPKVSSLTERLLSLAVDKILPRPIVSYLLFRPELSRLPGRKSMLRTRDSIKKRFRWNWENDQYECHRGVVTQPPRSQRSARLGDIADFFR